MGRFFSSQNKWSTKQTEVKSALPGRREAGANPREAASMKQVIRGGLLARCGGSCELWACHLIPLGLIILL